MLTRAISFNKPFLKFSLVRTIINLYILYLKIRLFIRSVNVVDNPHPRDNNSINFSLGKIESLNELLDVDTVFKVVGKPAF